MQGMILELFFILIFLSMILLFFGLFFQIPILSILGFTFLFFIGVLIFLGTVSYQTGDTFNITNNPDNTTYIVKDYQFTNFNSTTCTIPQVGLGCDNIFGVFLSIVAGFGITYVLIYMGTERREYD